MSVSHPNILTCHKMCIVRLRRNSLDQPLAEGPEGAEQRALEAECLGSGGSRRSGTAGAERPLVRNIDGSAWVEVVSPQDVLQLG